MTWLYASLTVPCFPSKQLPFSGHHHTKGVGFQGSDQAPPGAQEKQDAQEEVGDSRRGDFQPDFCHAPSELPHPWVGIIPGDCQ